MPLCTSDTYGASNSRIRFRARTIKGHKTCSLPVKLAMAPLRYLVDPETVPFEAAIFQILDYKSNHREITADILLERPYLHPDAQYAIALDGHFVLAVLEMQRVITDDVSYPITTRVTQLIVFGSETLRVPEIASQLIITAVNSIPTGRLQIYTPLPSEVMEGPLSNYFVRHGDTSNLSEGMFLFHGWHLPPPCSAEVQALSTRKYCTRPGCDNLATIECAGVCIFVSLSLSLCSSHLRLETECASFLCRPVVQATASTSA